MRSHLAVLATVVLFYQTLVGPLRAQTGGGVPPDDMSSMSIVGYDPATGELGVALASRYFAVAPVAAHVRAGVGAIATMSGSPFKDAPLMLDWLEQGATLAEVLERVRGMYPQGIGQMNLVDARGNSLSTTNPAQSRQWNGHKYGKHYAAAGNILAGPRVVEAFAQTFEETENLGVPLAERLLEALEAADAAGGDARGRMGATLIVRRPGGNSRGTDDVVNLRVDDSESAVLELRKLYMRWKGEVAQIPGFRDLGMTQGSDVTWLQESLKTLGYLHGNESTVFNENGQARGLFEDVTAAAVSRYKSEHALGNSPSAGLETVNSILRVLALRGSASSYPTQRSLRGDPGPRETVAPPPAEPMSSLSIVGYDPASGDVGNCMTSKYFAVGPVASFARAGVGAITVMGGGPFTMGEEMLDWMEKEGLTPLQVLERVRGMLDDTGQINIVNVKGESISTTGPGSSLWKGHRFSTNYATSGNILAGPAVVDAFANTFEATEGSGLPLAERLLRACEAAYSSGGDARGIQGAQLKVYREGAGPLGTDLLVDLRVDDSTQAIRELRRLWEEWKFHHMYGMGSPIEQTAGDDVRQVQRHLRTLGYLDASNREVFDERGEPVGVFNDATAAAVSRWKQASGMDAEPYLVQYMLLELERQASERGGAR